MTTQPTLLYFEPKTCDDQGNTPYPYLYLAHWSEGLSWLVVDAPMDVAGTLVSPNVVRESIDTVPRRLQPEEIVDKVQNNTTSKE
jgi:hypothetical protein